MTVTPSDTHRLPNLLLVGVQKSGTTWLHQTLTRSRHIFGSEKKEVNFWGRRGCLKRLDEYAQHFPVDGKPGAQFFMESTPHYFHAPNHIVDIAKQIRFGLPTMRPMVILRDPVDRYRSAYIHHMRKGRKPYTAHIDSMTDDHIMLSTGLYGKILEHWLTVFPDLIVLSYDDLHADPGRVVRQIFDALDVPCDLNTAALPEAIHTSARKVAHCKWPQMPQLTDRLREELKDFFREDTTHLQNMVPFDVMHWVEAASEN